MGCSTSTLNTLQQQTKRPIVNHPSLYIGDTHHLVCLTSSSYGSIHVGSDGKVGICSVIEEKIGCFDGLDGCVVHNGKKVESFDCLDGFVVDNDEKIASFDGLDACNDEKIGFFDGLDGDGVVGNGEKVKTCGEMSEKIGSFDGFDHGVVGNGEKVKTCGKKIETVNMIDEKVNGLDGDDDDNNVINTWELMEVLEGNNDVVGKSFELGSLDFGYFDQTLKKPNWDFVGCGEKLKNLCDFDGKKCNLGGNLGNNGKKLSDDGSYVFVELNSDEGELNLVVDSFEKTNMPLVDHVGRVAMVSKHACEKTDIPSLDHIEGYNHMLPKPSSDKIVLYFTSLRGIRRTYEDCCAIRLILRGFRVLIEEKDISMDFNYRKELQTALNGKAMTLPQLFIGGEHIGGAHEIKEMHETGKLDRLLSRFPVCDRGLVCERCGESRFIPCLNCNGSQKVFDEDEGRTMKCDECNENGLVRCPGCCH